ncbi:MAG TPA: sulfatase-like hydrolase/transferase [Verrucomicrobiae bacterium]
MKTFLIGAILSSVAATAQLSAANLTWSGGGTDNNWNTPANWSGTAPANNNNLNFSGATRLANTNNLTGLTLGWLQFANGDFNLNGNALTLNSGGSGLITNSAGINTISLPLTISPAGKWWSVAANSELRLAGAVTNTSATGTSTGWLFLTNGGAVRIMNAAQSTRGMDLFQGTVIVDGGVADASNDGIRFKVPAGQTAAVTLTNNGTMRVGGGGNFRMGDTGSAAGSLSRLTIASGTLELYGPAVTLFVSDRAGAPATVDQNGGLVWGSAGSGNTLTFANATGGNGTYNFNGGTLCIGQIKQANAAATATFNFNGGILKPTASSPAFFQGVQTANVQTGGAIIDTTNFNITIGQNLLAAGGGLTKLGSGTLTLSGTNTYAGDTLVSNGALLVNGWLAGNGAVEVAAGFLSGTGNITGPVVVQSGATLSPGAAVGTLTLQNNLTLAGNLWLTVDKSQSVTNGFVQVSGSLINSGNGTLTISNAGPVLVAGDSFKLFSQALVNGGTLMISPATPAAGLAWKNQLAVDGSISVVTAPIVATPADLTGLELSIGTLSPVFSSNILSYAATTVYSNRTVMLTPTAANPGATIRIIGNGVTNVTASGAASSPIALKAGTNVIDVQIVAPDNSITKDYFINFKRTPPNIVVILADDQGFSDWSCYGSEIPTPNLDRLAAGGLRFRQFYNCARCSPTRCSLLTGLYTQQVAVDPGASLPNLRDDNNVTLAELLGANGYRTYMAGKWNLGNTSDLLPEGRGFQEVWRYFNGNDHSEDTWNTNLYTLVSPDGEITNRIYGAGQFYQPDALGDYSLDFINNALVTHTNDKPFFLYMPFGSAHFPIQAPKDWVDTNAPVYAQGWDYLRNWRYTNMLATGVIDTRFGLSPNDGTAPWNNVPAEVILPWNLLPSDRQADLARRMAIYAAMVQKMDANIGRVVQRLQDLGQLDNTLIFAMSDNGGNYEGGVYGLTGSTSDATPVTGTDLDNMGLSGQPVIYLGGGWAHVSNTPFRLYKHFTHEGGVRTPLIVHWPQGVARTNAWEEQVGHVIDIAATIVDVTGASYPTQYNAHPVLPLEGRSLASWFTVSNEVPRDLGFEHEVNRAWISGNWKFVTKNFDLVTGTSPANELELYDQNTDQSEMTNLASVQPVILNQMMTNWNAWAVRVGVPAARWLTINTNLSLPVPATNASDLFVDDFNRPDNTDIDASAAGMWGSRVPPIGANAAYYEGYEGSGSATSIQIANDALQMAVGAGMSESGLQHNFIGQDIIDAGGFSVALTVQNINTDTSDASNRYAGFGVGLSQAEAATGADIYSTPAPGAVAFRGSTTGNTGAADFFVELDLNGNIKVWHDGSLLDTVFVGENYGTVTASFALSGFTTNDTVTVTVFFNGQLVDINTPDTNSVSRTFKWDRNDSNYIGLSARASNYVQLDNLIIRKLPLADGLATDYALQHGLSGADSAPASDPDNDGVSNFGEWAFGGDPTAPDAFIASLKGVQLTSARAFQFEYQRLINATSYGLRYRYFVSPDLQTWIETIPQQTGVASNEDRLGYEVVTLQLPASVTNGQNKLFLRVLAEPAD